MKPGVEITAQRAAEFGLAKQGAEESEITFKKRISGKLREMGHPIEAHEAYNNALYDDPEGGAITGILGVVAQDFNQKNYKAENGDNRIGLDIAAGELAKAPKRDNSALTLLLFALLSDKD